jgi:oligoribonuclease NrnB/cAMP/cGMP phosphodiesterase (DHH superfamily)
LNNDCKRRFLGNGGEHAAACGLGVEVDLDQRRLSAATGVVASYLSDYEQREGLLIKYFQD